MSKFRRWFIKIILPPFADPMAVGDYEEIFQRIKREEGTLQAHIWLWSQVLRSFIPFLCHTIIWRITMFANYLKIALRIMRRHKGYAFINIVGLAVGMACCFVILLYVSDEVRYDSFHVDADRLYRVVRQMPDIHGPSTRNPLGPALKKDFPEIEMAVRTWLLNDPVTFIIDNNQAFQQEQLLFTDYEFFQFYTVSPIAGNISDPLREPYSIVLTQSMAIRYFGIEDAVGKRLSFDGAFDLNVTAVIEDLPHTTHLRAQAFMSIEDFNRIAGYVYGYDPANFRLSDAWNAGMYNTYVKLHKNTDPQQMERKFPQLLEKYAPYNSELLDETLTLQSVKDIHLNSPYRSPKDKMGDIKGIYATLAIGIVILLMSCFNYINLTTARFSTRLRETGIRKVVGAQRRQLISQFLFESVVIAGIAFIIAFGLLILASPYINALLETRILESAFQQNSLFFIIFWIGFAVALLSGSYPALFFSAHKPIDSIKTKGHTSRGRNIKRGIVIFQFVITIALLICTGIIRRQIQFMKNHDLGFTREQILVVPIKDDAVRERTHALQTQWLQVPGVSQVSFSAALPSTIRRGTTMDLEVDGQRLVFEMNNTTVDEHFFDLYQISIKEGRAFSPQFPSDRKDGIILNESAVKILQWEDSIGRELRIFGGIKKVIGVVRDFNFQTLHINVTPLALRYKGDPIQFASIKISTQNMPETLQRVETTFKKFAPKRIFESFFFDDAFEHQYRSEENFGRMISTFSTLAILISCMGLFGLAFFITEQRIKEIGIRKVLGATVLSITFLLSRSFLKWTLISNLIAWPLAAFVMERWLQNFAFRINLTLGIFIGSGFLALGLVFLSVSYQSLRAALSNPVDSLHYE